MMLGFCGACVYWETLLSAAMDSGGQVKGACHRFPPAVYLLGNGPQGPVVQTQFPMPHSKMWCGEFSPRVKDPN